MLDHPGARLRAAIATRQPLVVAGVINAYCALQAEKAGIRAIYLSGAGVANACFGLPDLGMTSLDNVAEEVRRITAIASAPLIVDADTGWGNCLMVARATRILEKAGAAAIHIEDQPFEKRCGHLAGKLTIPTSDMVDRIKAAIEGRDDPSFIIIARTDALATEGLTRTIERVNAYIAAGADVLFLEAITDLSQLESIKAACPIPILINLTEFGKTPPWTAEEIGASGANIVLFPLSAFRAMSRAAEQVYHAIANHGSTQDILSSMQTREELYTLLNYKNYERQMDQWLDKKTRSPV